jgi:hypothetical protein
MNGGVHENLVVSSRFKLVPLNMMIERFHYRNTLRLVLDEQE